MLPSNVCSLYHGFEEGKGVGVGVGDNPNFLFPLPVINQTAFTGRANGQRQRRWGVNSWRMNRQRCGTTRAWTRWAGWAWQRSFINILVKEQWAGLNIRQEIGAET